MIQEEAHTQVSLLDHSIVDNGEPPDTCETKTLVRYFVGSLGRKGQTLPGSTRFLSASMPTVPAPEFTSRRFADSRAACPLAAHSRSCRSYLRSFSEGPWKIGGVWLITISVMLMAAFPGLASAIISGSLESSLPPFKAGLSGK